MERRRSECREDGRSLVSLTAVARLGCLCRHRSRRRRRRRGSRPGGLSLPRGRRGRGLARLAGALLPAHDRQRPAQRRARGGRRRRLGCAPRRPRPAGVQVPAVPRSRQDALHLHDQAPAVAAAGGARRQRRHSGARPEPRARAAQRAPEAVSIIHVVGCARREEMRRSSSSLVASPFWFASLSPSLYSFRTTHCNLLLSHGG